MAILGHDITLITTDFYYDSDFIKKISQFGVKVVVFKKWFNFQSFLYSPNLKKWAKKNVKNFDIIHMHNFRSYQNKIIYNYSKKYNIPYILHPNGSVLRIVEKKLLKLLYDLIWGYKILNNCSNFIAVSNFEINQFNQICKNKKITKIYNMLDIERYNKRMHYGKFRSKFHLDNRPVLLFSGRIHKRKGIDFLIKTFGEVKKVIKNAVLVIIGPDGGDKERLLDLVKELNISDIQFINYIDPNSGFLNEAYHDADVVIYPSILEIFGLVPFEAILCDTPVIVSDDCGCGEIVKEANCGYLVQYGNIKELKEKIIYIINHKDEAKKLVENGKKFIINNLDSNVIVKKIIQLYEKVLLSK